MFVTLDCSFFFEITMNSYSFILSGILAVEYILFADPTILVNANSAAVSTNSTTTLSFPSTFLHFIFLKAHSNSLFRMSEPISNSYNSGLSPLMSPYNSPTYISHL